MHHDCYEETFDRLRGTDRNPVFKPRDGDLVRVSGEMEDTLFGDRELQAEAIVTVAE